MSKPKKITVEVAIPVSVQLHVTWDEDAEEAVIHKVELSPHGQMLEPRSIHENVDDDMLTEIDRLTKEAFGIKE